MMPRRLLILPAALPASALAQDGAGVQRLGLWGLFEQSFDLFTILLLLGSLVAVAVIVRCVIDIRGGRILPRASVERAEELIEEGRWRELRDFARRDESFVGATLRAALEHPGMDKPAMRDAAELAASEQCARWFRKIEILNVLGNLGPLVGLAGTVWGMIIAFTSLGATGGEAGPAELSAGIAKALFHTLLGLLLAIPCLTVYGIYRSVIDRACNRGLVVVGSMVDRLPAFKPRKRSSSRDASRDDDADPAGERAAG